MNALSTLENGLFALGQVLRFPVMVLLWVCVASALFMAGSCAADWLARRRERQGFDLDLWLRKGTVRFRRLRKRVLPSALRRLLAEMEQGRKDDTLNDGGLEHLVLESEERVRKDVLTARRCW